MHKARADAAMDQLLEGYARFRSNYWRPHSDELAALAQGQSPSSMVIACCDSRVPPEVIFDCAPGQIFVVRVIANLVPLYAPDMANHGTSAALEFAVRELEVPNIVVLGHSQCGGIQALLQDPRRKPTDFIGNWMNIAREAARRTHAMLPENTSNEAKHRFCEQESIRISLRNLESFPWIKSRLEAGALRIRGLYFEVGSGDLHRIDAEAGE
jgi:carbonic anhydrase